MIERDANALDPTPSSSIGATRCEIRHDIAVVVDAARTSE
jgi:hypothetical protein